MLPRLLLIDEATTILKKNTRFAENDSAVLTIVFNCIR